MQNNTFVNEHKYNHLNILTVSQVKVLYTVCRMTLFRILYFHVILSYILINIGALHVFVNVKPILDTFKNTGLYFCMI